MSHGLRDAWERFLLYLPLAVMGLLALGTYWLVRSTPGLEPVASASAPDQNPDYFMQGFSLRTFDAQGHLRSEVLGEQARHYPNTRWLEIDGIRIRSFDPQGRLTTASASQGLTNDDFSEVHLRGNALVEREPLPDLAGDVRLRYQGEFLHAYLRAERVTSNKPVELQRGADRFSADSLDFDNAAQVLQLRGRVRSTLVPSKTLPTR